MKIKISKEFEKSAKKLSGKYKDSLRKMILEIQSVQFISEITNCKKLIGYKSVYRVRLGDYRVFFIFEIIEQTIYLKYLVSRGDSYSKEYEEKLKFNDN